MYDNHTKDNRKKWKYALGMFLTLREMLFEGRLKS